MSSLLPDRRQHSLFPARTTGSRLGSASGRSSSSAAAAGDIHARIGRIKPYTKVRLEHHRDERRRRSSQEVSNQLPNSNTRWNHDLFEDDSNLYGPRVRYQPSPRELITFGPVRPSPSLRPFGATPAPTSAPATGPLPPQPSSETPSAPAVPQPPKSLPVVQPTVPVKPPPNNPASSHSGLSLLSRIQSSDTQKSFTLSDPSSLPHGASPSILRRPDQPIKIQSQNSKNQHEFDLAMEKYLNGPVILEVANLADGTSAEDVKTAFADFGEIQECTTEEGARQGNQPTLKAKMIFTHKGDAEKAVEALNGALADGLTLAVKIIGRPTKKPERSDFRSPGTGVSEAKTAKVTPTDTVMKAAEEEDVTMEDGQAAAAAIVPTGRLRSEAVAQCDPRASIQLEPKPIPVYRPEPPKPPQPPVRNMLSRVQPFAGTHPAIFSHRATFGLPSPLHRTHDADSSKSLLARIKPN